MKCQLKRRPKWVQKKVVVRKKVVATELERLKKRLFKDNHIRNFKFTPGSAATAELVAANIEAFFKEVENFGI